MPKPEAKESMLAREIRQYTINSGKHFFRWDILAPNYQWHYMEDVQFSPGTKAKPSRQLLKARARAKDCFSSLLAAKKINVNKLKPQYLPQGVEWAQNIEL